MTDNLFYDVVILGSGPAGLQAAIHASRKKVSVLVMGRTDKSSLYVAHVENYFSLFNISGADMLKAGREQARAAGAEFMEADVLRLAVEGPLFSLETEDHIQVAARAMIFATGSRRKRLGVPGEKALVGRGVSYCVDCDGNFFRGQRVTVVGDESAAIDGAMTLARIADEVHLVTGELKADDRLRKQLADSGIQMVEGEKVAEIRGDDAVTGIVLQGGREISADGVFIELGAKGIIEMALPLGILLDDEMKYIRVNKKQETNIPGVFAAGDICGPPWQMAKAVGEGCVAGIGAAAYAKKAAKT